MPVISFETRRKKIKTVACINKQIEIALKYAKNKRKMVKLCDGTLADKIALNEEAKQADAVCRELRLRYFEIEDEINAEKLKGATA